MDKLVRDLEAVAAVRMLKWLVTGVALILAMPILLWWLIWLPV